MSSYASRIKKCINFISVASFLMLYEFTISFGKYNPPPTTCIFIKIDILKYIIQNFTETYVFCYKNLTTPNYLNSKIKDIT